MRILKVALWPILMVGTIALLWVTVKLAAPKEDAFYALKTLWNGAFGTTAALATTSARALILVLYALGIVLSFRGGLLNIGAEGQSRVGAAAAAALAVTSAGGSLSSLGFAGIILLMLFGAGAGAGWALLAGLLRQWRGVPEVISTLMLNFIGLLLARWLVSSSELLRGDTIFQQSNPLPDALQLSTWNEYSWAVWLGIPAAIGAHVYLFHTVGGFRLRATGLNAMAALTAGISVKAGQLRAFLYAGALAGLAGAIGLLARGRFEADPAYPDYGYIAIAVALMADLKPLYVLPSAIIFAALEVGTRSMEINANVSHDVAYVIEGLVILAILVRGVQVLKGRTGAAAGAAEEAAA